MRQRQASRPRLLQAMFDALRLPDLRRRILFTIGMLIVYRLVANIPVPGVDLQAWLAFTSTLPYVATKKSTVRTVRTASATKVDSRLYETR